MKSPDLLLTRDSFGSKDIGDRWVTTTSGCGDIGSILRLKGPAGRIRITTTIAKAGNGTKGIGTTRITTTAIGAIMIVDGSMVITTTKVKTTTKRPSATSRGFKGCRRGIDFRQQSLAFLVVNVLADRLIGDKSCKDFAETIEEPA